MMENQAHNLCPLCKSSRTTAYFEDKNRPYLSCARCNLVFVPDTYHLTTAEEKREYDLHNNDPDDPGYCRFLSRLTRPLAERLEPGSSGLDFGCGPGPALHRLIEAEGHAMALYDPFYFNDNTVFSKTYDFITATEVVEHLREPDREFDRLLAVLKSGGWLGLMTKLVIDKSSFMNWHYIRDLTHICFYSQATFEFISLKYNTRLDFIDKDVILLQKR